MLPEDEAETHDAVKLADRARITFPRATLAVSAYVAPLGADRYQIAVALLDGDSVNSRIEESGADRELAHRRAALLVMQLLRERLQAG